MLWEKICSRLRGVYYSVTKKLSIRRSGKNTRILGSDKITCKNLSIGDGCWIQAVKKYKGQSFTPHIKFGNRVMMSNNVHISSVNKITFGENVLLGSNIYIGDHSHGSTKPDKFDPSVPPALRLLDDIGVIEIGDNVWICDGVVILADTRIGNGSIIGAMSLVKGIFPENCLIAGNPAKIIKRLK